MRLLTIFIAGFLFAAGLVISGMTQPSKIVGFLDIFGDWDPSLALVMGGAVGVHALAYRWVKGRSSPLLAPTFQIPTKRDIDSKLVIGSAVFGVGWGLSGYCPGPAVSSLVVGDPRTVIFVASLISTMVIYSLVTGSISGRANRNKPDHELGTPRAIDSPPRGDG
jgi:uncharacterized protein